MSVNTDHAETDGGTGRDEDGSGWTPVPTGADEGTVGVRWSDLVAMRARIDDLEDENRKLRAERDRLAAELRTARRDTDTTIQRYERLLEKRTGTPRPTDETEEERGLFARVLAAVRSRVR